MRMSGTYGKSIAEIYVIESRSLSMYRLDMKPAPRVKPYCGSVTGHMLSDR